MEIELLAESTSEVARPLHNVLPRLATYRGGSTLTECRQWLESGKESAVPHPLFAAERQTAVIGIAHVAKIFAT
jgi:hypothetical protein